MRATIIRMILIFFVVSGLLVPAVCAGTQQSKNTLQLISPLWRYTSTEELPSIQRVREGIEEYISDAIANKRANHVSVYFRDLSNGPWFGINEREGFIPASLLKVPVMISAFKMAERDPKFLARKVVAGGDEIFSPSYVSTVTALAGREYTIDDLLKIMITYSDNSAAFTLANSIDSTLLKDVFEDLGIGNPFEDTPEVYQIRIKDYAGFFRILYNASYLSPEYSQRALELLTHSQFGNGFLRAVPRGVVVAHKFGERTMPDNSRQLHECGIIYQPGRPYLLCVMTRGEDFGALAKIIRDITEQVDKYIRSSCDNGKGDVVR